MPTFPEGKIIDEMLKSERLAFGFIGLIYRGCREEHVLAFSCKKRGFCPSYCAKRMAEARVHLRGNIQDLALKISQIEDRIQFR
jgi:hypothetical protein